MAVTKTWSINDLERETSDNYVCWVHWSIKGTEDSKTFEMEGTTFLPRPDTLVDYATLTEETVIGWVKAKLNADSPAVDDEATGKTAVQRLEDEIDARIAALDTSAISTGKPF